MSNLAFYATPIDFNKNDGLEKKLNDTKKPIIISTGMSTLDQIKTAVEFFDESLLSIFKGRR